MFELKQEFLFIKNDILEIKNVLNIENKKEKINNINDLLNQETTWNDVRQANKLLKEKSILEKTYNEFINISKQFDDLFELYLLMESANEINDTNSIKEINEEFTTIKKQIEIMKINAIFKDESDHLNAFIEINAGVGGTDSQDWAEMLMRMYVMFANKNQFNIEIINKSEGEEAGIKNATLLITGENIYGLLKNETGIHRLVRISPYNANAKRQTSFAGIFCYPEIKEDIKINIDEKDLRIDVYRSSGAGGQHVNKTESAVRITHLPTNIAVQSQIHRSQIQNRNNALKLLQSKLYDLELKKKEKEKNDIESNKSDISWGNQIRNYVLNPYKLVKDLRSHYETGNIDAILDGDLMEMIFSVLKANKTSFST